MRTKPTANTKFVVPFREENTSEYQRFKRLTDEDRIIADKISDYGFEGGTMLDIGGREAQISSQLTSKEDITLVDPDPVPNPEDITKHEKKIQQFLDQRSKTFDLILCSHVLGDLGRQDSQESVVKELINCLSGGGALVLAYNDNRGVLGELLSYAKTRLDQPRYDYFEETILDDFDGQVKKERFSVQLVEDSFYDLGVMCWVLFGTGEDDIEDVARDFELVLKQKLSKPSLRISQCLTIVQPRQY